MDALLAGAVHETAVGENHGRAASVRESSCLSHFSAFLPLSPAVLVTIRTYLGFEEKSMALRYRRACA